MQKLNQLWWLAAIDAQGQVSGILERYFIEYLSKDIADDRFA